MRSLGNTASAMGKGLVQASEALLDAQMGEFERLKEFGVKARDEGSKVAFTFKGVTTEVEKNSGAIVGYLEKIGNTDFKGAMERQSKTLNGALSNLEDSAAALMDRVGSSGLSRELAALAQQMGATASAGDGMAQRLGQGLGVVVGVVGLMPQAFNVAAQSIGIVLGTLGSSILSFGIGSATVFRGLLKGLSDYAAFFGQKVGQEQLAAIDEQIASMKEWKSTADDFTSASSDQAGPALLSLGERWDALVNRTLAGTAANQGASMSLDELAASSGKAGAAHGANAKEIEAQKKALLSLTDRLDPAGAKARQLAADVAMLNTAFKDHGSAEYRFLMGELTGVWTDARDKLEPLTLELIAAGDALERFKGMPDHLPTPGASESSMKVETEDLRTDLDKAQEEFSTNLLQGMQGAFAYGIGAFLSGSKDAAQQFGDALKNVMLDAVSEYLSKMLMMLAEELAVRLANVAKEAAARRAANASSGGSSGGGGMMSGLSSMFGGGGGMGSGMSSGTVALGAWVAIAAAAVAILKHQSDRADAVRYNTNVRFNTHDDGVNTTFVGGKLMETGNKIGEAFRQLADEVQSATGALLEGAHSAAISIRNDKKGFKALVDGVLVGVFGTAEEAIVAAMKKLFNAENLKNQMDPIVQQVIDNFDAKKGPQAFAEAVRSVSEIMNGLSGLTEIELSLRDLPSQASQLATKLHAMGVAMSDATVVANQWVVNQLKNIRDQITGHEATAAEQMAEKERQAAMFNAQLALTKATMAIDREELIAKIANAKAHVNVENWKLEFDTWKMKRDYDLAKGSAEIAQYELDVRTAAADASIALLEAQLAAINQAMAALDAIKPIDFGEIRLPGRGGGHGGGNINAGPRPAEQLALDIKAFNDALDGVDRSLLSDLAGRILDINKWYAEQTAEAIRLGQPLERVNELYEKQLKALAQETLAGLGIASVTTQQQMESLRLALEFLRDQGAISADQLRELGDQMYVSLVDGLLQFIENEDVRRRLEELRFRMQMYQYQLQFAALRALNIMSDQEVMDVERIFGAIWEAFEAGNLGFQNPGGAGGNQNGDSGADSQAAAIEAARARREQALISALDRLRNIAEQYKAFRENLATSELSGLTTQQRSDSAAEQFNRMMARAQAGDVDAMAAMPDLARQYLELLGQTIDPSSAQYQQIREQILAQMAGIEGGINGLLNGAGSPAQQQLTELRTISEILNEIRLLWGGNPSWNPGSGSGTILPGPGPRPGATIGGANGNGTTIRVYDAASHQAIERMEARLAARLDAGLARVAKATETQTAKSEARSFRSSPKAGKAFGRYDRDEMAS